MVFFFLISIKYIIFYFKTKKAYPKLHNLVIALWLNPNFFEFVETIFQKEIKNQFLFNEFQKRLEENLNFNEKEK